jgi:hypothetical protein
MKGNSGRGILIGTRPGSSADSAEESARRCRGSHLRRNQQDILRVIASNAMDGAYSVVILIHNQTPPGLTIQFLDRLGTTTSRSPPATGHRGCGVTRGCSWPGRNRPKSFKGGPLMRFLSRSATSRQLPAQVGRLSLRPWRVPTGHRLSGQSDAISRFDESDRRGAALSDGPTSAWPKNARMRTRWRRSRRIGGR